MLPVRPHMDIFWANAAILALPSSQRVEVLVHDGSSDLRLWPGPGGDRDLLDAYGPGLREALDAQRVKARGGIALGDVVRLHPGKLHCNYLLWVATRGPEQNAQRADAPNVALIEQVVVRSLEFAGSNGSISVAFGALGDGPKAAPPEERLASIVRAAHRHQESCYASGKPARVEIVRVCDARSGVTAAARRLVGRLAHAAPEPAPSARESAADRSPKKTLAGGRPRSASAPAGKRRGAEGLDAGDVAQRRVTASPYDRAHRYRETEWFVHPRFGVGQVRRVTPDGAIEVLFEDGSTKKMLHASPG
jgi:O-acetyl-ADP-ribose deacetylase (regulator of RNase III)